MLIIPAIDIIKGRVVRLYQGDFNKEKIYSDDPISVAKDWQKKGAGFLHIVDLEGAREGNVKNKKIITQILQSVNIPCEVGGGLREIRDIEYFLKQGAHRIVLGTKAIDDIYFLKKLLGQFCEKIAVSIDFKGRVILKKGWQEKTDFAPEEIACKMQDIGVKTIILTDIGKDGTLMGPNIEVIEKIIDKVDISIIVSGGIGSLDDIRKFNDIGRKNLEGVIIGSALYEGRVDLKKALKAVKCQRVKVGNGCDRSFVRETKDERRNIVRLVYGL